LRKFQNNKIRTGRSLAGYTAKQNGKDAESLLDKTAEYYASTGEALIYKRYEPYKRVSGGTTRVFKAVYAGKAGCDYSIWLPDGRAGMIEVKSRDSKRIRIDALNDDQHKQLAMMKQFNMLAYVLVRLSDRWFLIDYANWLHPKRKSHNTEQLQTIGNELKITHIIKLLDFIE